MKYELVFDKVLNWFWEESEITSYEMRVVKILGPETNIQTKHVCQINL